MLSRLPALRASAIAACYAAVLFAFSPGCVASAGAQTASASQEEDLGILVVPTQQRANELLKKLQDGWDFGVLARENSIDPTGSDGGYLGRLAPEDLQAQLRDAVHGIAPGQYSGVVSTTGGYAILTVFAQSPVKPEMSAAEIHALAQRGAVRYGIDVGGMAEADGVFNATAKPEGWARDLQQVCTIRKQSYAEALTKIGQKLKAEEAVEGHGSQPLEILRDHIALSQLYSYSGKMHEAVDEYKSALKIAQASVPDAVPYFLESLGVLYLHWAEMENGAYREPGEKDFFPPLDPATKYTKIEESQQATHNLQQYLELKPDDYQARWLLNLTYATLGQYPAGVPEKYLIPQAAFESKENLGRFRDIAPAAGLNVFLSAGGAIVDDFENNGLLDVIVSSTDVCDPLHYFHNNGNGTFSDRTKEAGLSDQLGGLNMIQGDYNNDGCMDFLVLRGGWEFAMRKSLLKNNCNGTFTDVTDASGLGRSITSTQSAVWADIDNDGNLDLFVANENTPAQLFRNRGDGTFEDISHAAGIDKTAFSKGAAAADYDNDGFVDFYVSNLNGPNFLYRNNGDGTFTEIAKQAGVREPMFSFATWFFDYDNDGWPDLFVTSYFNSMDESVRNYLELPTKVETLRLYRNLHNGAFEDVTAKVSLDRVFVPMGANFGDIDNDGYLDMYLGMGNPSLGSLLPHELLRNDAGQKFVDITTSSGTGELHKGHGVAFADLRRNGQEDIIAEVGGAIPSDKHTVRVFQNPGNSNDWINLKLVGVKSNRSAVGAKIHVTVEDARGHARSIWRTVGETGSFGGNPIEEHIGVGANAAKIALDIWWPATNSRQHFDAVPKNQFLEIKEFATVFTRLERKALAMGGQAK